jgi:predicted amidohydrolase
MAFQVRAAVIQFPVTMDIAANLGSLSTALEALDSGTFAVAPEGALSGYLPEPGFVTAIDQDHFRRGLEAIRALTVRRGLHLVVGACLDTEEGWRNAALYLGPKGELRRYDKINLAQSERGTFRPGDHLPVFALEYEGERLCLGIQMCREIRYPEQWRVLATRGAQVIVHVNNAVGSPDGFEVWRSHLISRAAETQRFVLSANNAGPDQLCPSVIVAPSGKVLAQIDPGAEATALGTLALAENSDWVLNQARSDVVAVRSLP